MTIDRCNTVDNVIYKANLIWSLEGRGVRREEQFCTTSFTPTAL